jgi:hypothetical protein
LVVIVMPNPKIHLTALVWLAFSNQQSGVAQAVSPKCARPSERFSDGLLFTIHPRVSF